MNESIQTKNEQQSDLERARMLRQEAELLEKKERIRGRLRQLIELSKDPYYDQYLMQMMKDLDSGKATPEQVEREAERSYGQYRQRMAQNHATKASKPNPNPNPNPTPKAKPPRKQGGMEFKVGIHAFSLIGAAFVLIAFVIFSNRFMNGFWQGICLYLAAAALVALSELLLYRRSPRFSHVVTGIGIGGLYAANMANYLVLHVVSGIVAMIITIVTALVTLALSRKKDSTVIRIIGLLGCYISFFPLKGFGTELNFLITGLMILVINLLSAFLQNQKNQELLNILHVATNLIFTILLLEVAMRENLQPVYMILYVIMSFAFVELLCLRQYKKEQKGLLLAGYIINGIHMILLYLLTPILNVSGAEALFIRVVAEALVVLISIGVFVLWDKGDGRRFAQIYYMVLAVLLLSSASDYHLEIILTVLGGLCLTRLFSRNEELTVLDYIVSIWTAGAGIWFADYWYCWLLSGALLLGLLFVRQKPLFHEILVTVALIVTWSIYATYTLPDIPLLKENRTLSLVVKNIGFPVEIAGLLLLFLLMNHWRGLRQCNQKPYNLFQIIAVSISYCYFWISSLSRRIMEAPHRLGSGWIADGNWAVTLADTVMLILGVCYILLVLRKRYGVEISWKHWIITAFLILSILTGHYGMPVVVSILLMVVALGCVGFGFRLGDKAERICGLVLAAIVCLKLVLYDFREVGDIYRVIVFLVVGILALIISFIYIQLEKSADKQKLKAEQENSEVQEMQEAEQENSEVQEMQEAEQENSEVQEMQEAEQENSEIQEIEKVEEAEEEQQEQAEEQML